MRTKKLVFMAVLTAIALIIFIIEAQLPPPVPVPGVKLGLANIITLAALVTLGKKEAFLILIARIVLGSIFAGSVVSCMYSLAGGLVCYVLMSLLLCFMGTNMLWLVSIIGAAGHNIGQILTAAAMTHTIQIIWYLPVLIISAVITGAFTGISAQTLLKHAGGLITRMTGDIK